ncbi:MAG: ribosome assembly RNA-binding protein YhbY [gamma proteobacterium symbiont of Phacoides pectinatus]
MSITQKQKRHLKGLVHHLKPVVIFGQNGLNDGVFGELECALLSHELIKARVNAGDREERQALLQAICTRTGAQLIHAIGHVAAFYRRNPDAPRITLPAD